MAECFDVSATKVLKLDATNCTVEIGESLGVGGYSQVFRGKLTKIPSKEEFKVAAKKVRSAPVRDAEIEALKRLNHKNVIQFHGVFRCEDDTYIIMELAENGDLHHFLMRYRLSQEKQRKKPRLPEGFIWKWVFEAASAIEFLHSGHFNHRDVKSQNFLVMGDFVLKLGDMGLVIQMEHTQQTKGRGTCQWMAPEVIKCQKRSMKSDVFSFGVVVWEIFSTDIPFSDRTGDFQVMTAVCNGERPTIPKDCPEYLTNLMNSCWQEEYTKRPDMKTICEGLKTKCQTEVDCLPESSLVADFPNDVHMETVSPPSSGTKLGLSKGASPYPSFGCVLSDKYLMKLAEELGREWEHLGIYLEFSRQEIDRFGIDNNGNVLNATHKMLVRWRQKQNPDHGLKQVVENLSQALAGCQRQDLASKVLKLLQEYSS